MKRPKRIKIGPYDYDVSFKKKGRAYKKKRENIGETDTQNLSIFLKKGKHQVEADTLLHETLHAIFASSGITTKFFYKEEEDVIGVISPWLMMMLLDNPQLVEFLLKDVNEL